jgi:hypothetical protein
MSFIEKFEKKNSIFVDEIKFSIPEIQRNLNQDTVNKIIEFQKSYYNKNNHYCLNQTISIAINLENGEEYILDGQHRITAYKILRNEFPEREMQISVDYFFCLNYANIEKTYKYINTHSPNNITSLGIDEYKILNELEKLFMNDYKNYMKTSIRPHKPYLNIQIIKDTILNKKILKYVKNGRDLYEKIMELNKFYINLDKRYYDYWCVNDYLKIIEKINQFSNKLYLGLYSSYEWIDRLSDYYKLGLKFEEMEHYYAGIRPKILKKTRESVWIRDNGLSLKNGKCYCCSSTIDYNNFECGHVVSIYYGGKTTIDNLRAICSQCNNDMKTMNLEDYKELLNSQLTSELSQINSPIKNNSIFNCLISNMEDKFVYNNEQNQNIIIS